MQDSCNGQGLQGDYRGAFETLERHLRRGASVVSCTIWSKSHAQDYNENINHVLIESTAVVIIDANQGVQENRTDDNKAVVRV